MRRGSSCHVGRSLGVSNSSAWLGLRRLCPSCIGPLHGRWKPIFYRLAYVCLAGFDKQASQIDQRLPAHVRLRTKNHPGTEDLIEHPRRDFPIVPSLVIVDLAPKDVSAASFPATNNDLLSVQGMPRVVHPSNVGLVITLVGTCTTPSTATARYAL